jgi:hypothetical protein
MRSMLGAMGSGGGGFLNNIPGFKQLSQLRSMKNLDMNQMLGAMGGGAGGEANPFAGFPGMGDDASRQLPKGFNRPGVRATTDKQATKAKIDREKAKRKRKSARSQRKKK